MKQGNELLETFPFVFDEENNTTCIQGKKPGKTVALIGCIHGNERIGLEVMKAISKMNIESGTLYLIGGNPRAYNQKIRFTESDLNRCFTEKTDLQTYESRRAKEIMKFLQTCDATLDIHQSYTDDHFLLCREIGVSLARTFNVQYFCTNTKNLDGATTETFMESQGKIGICLEAENMTLEDQSHNFQLALTETKRFLVSQGMIDNKISDNHSQPRWIEAYACYKSKRNFKLASTIVAFKKLHYSEVIGYDGVEVITCSAEYDGCHILFPVNVNTPDTRAFFVGREMNFSSS